MKTNTRDESIKPNWKILRKMTNMRDEYIKPN
jgi:hypothetical protein